MLHEIKAQKYQFYLNTGLAAGSVFSRTPQEAGGMATAHSCAKSHHTAGIWPSSPLRSFNFESYHGNIVCLIVITFPVQDIFTQEHGLGVHIKYRCFFEHGTQAFTAQFFVVPASKLVNIPV
jgi:hypothetical protein